MSTSRTSTVNKQRAPAPTKASSSTSGKAYKVQVDPSLLAYGTGGHDVPIDPALFAIEQVVNDVRKGKIKPEVQDTTTQRSSGQGQGQGGQGANDGGTTSSSNVAGVIPADPPQNLGAVDTGGMDLLDEEFDPALREIVNSLTNAQQSSSILGTNLTQAQAQAAIDAHLSEDHENGMALKTLEDLERAGFGMISDQFPHVPDSYLLPESHAHTTSSPYLPDSHASTTPAGDGGTGQTPTRGDIRRRGRPKGSKNKPKPNQIPAGPPPPKETKKRGRPPKRRTEEELAELERERLEKENGVRKQRGRPRKFPGYLVREMRLKKNRPEYQELLRGYEGPEREIHRDSDELRARGGGGRHGHGANHGHGGGGGGDQDGGGNGNGGEDHHMGDGGEFWTGDMEQSILAAVGNFQETPHGDGQGEGEGGAGMDVDDLEEVPSSRAFEGGGGEMEMRRVFGLPPDTDSDPHHGDEHGHDHNVE